MRICTCPYEKLLGIHPVGVEPVHYKPSDINPGLLKWVKIGKHFSSGIMVQIKPKKVYGVETPHPRGFLGGISCIRIGCENVYIRQDALEHLTLSDTLHI